jgi:hypothetical protein
MVDTINTILSYDFIPKIIEVLKDSALYLLMSGISFLTLAIIAFILKGAFQKVFSVLAMGALIVGVLALVITITCIIMIPAMFAIVSIKIGFMDTFGWSELISGIISFVLTVGCIGLVAELIDKK